MGSRKGHSQTEATWPSLVPGGMRAWAGPLPWKPRGGRSHPWGDAGEEGGGDGDGGGDGGDRRPCWGAVSPPLGGRCLPCCVKGRRCEGGGGRSVTRPQSS